MRAEEMAEKGGVAAAAGAKFFGQMDASEMIPSAGMTA